MVVVDRAPLRCVRQLNCATQSWRGWPGFLLEGRFVDGRDVAELYQVLLHEGVQVWVDGGWGVDALLERQTRPHKDFDAIASFDDLPVLAAVLADRAFALKVIWEENRWVAHPESVPLIGREAPHRSVATAFVLSD